MNYLRCVLKSKQTFQGINTVIFYFPISKPSYCWFMTSQSIKPLNESKVVTYMYMNL